MHVAILTEDLAGMRAQAEGLARHAGLKTTFYPVRMRGLWSRIPARFCPTPLTAMDKIALASDTRLLISAGGTGAVAGLALKKITGLPLVQIQNPRMDVSLFDLVVANAHDHLSGPNIISINTALHGVTRARLQEGALMWHDRVKPNAAPLLSVLVGGSNGRFKFGVREARHLANSLCQFRKQNGMQIALTPSRRTDKDAQTLLAQMLRPLGIYVWDGLGENPYFGLLGCADAIAVTQDSVSMLSEAVATSAPVMVIPLPGHSQRITAFTNQLKAIDRIREFSHHWKSWPVEPLDDTARAADEMVRRLALQKNVAVGQG